MAAGTTNATDSKAKHNLSIRTCLHDTGDGSMTQKSKENNGAKDRAGIPPLYYSKLVYHIAKVAAPLGLFSFLHIAASKLFTPYLKKRYTFLTPGDLLYLYEKIPATINAIGSFMAAFYVIHIRRDYKADIIHSYSNLIDVTFASMLAFMIYDTGVMAKKGGEHWSVWLHHLLGIAGATTAQVYQVATFVPAWFTVPEITVVSSNLLWVLDKFKFSKGTSKIAGIDVYHATLWFRMILFAIFRAPSLPLCILNALRESYRSIQSPKNTESIHGSYPPKSSQDSITVSETASSSSIPNSTGTRSQGASKTKSAVTLAIRKLIADLKGIPPFVAILSILCTFGFGSLNIYWSVLAWKAIGRYTAKRGKVVKASHHF